MDENKKMDDILKFIEGVDYGEVVITIHDSQIVQVEKREKKRFNVQKRL
ncbi:YezD family protein [bacterium]|nr:YezD family protein [bacterium]